MTSPADPQFLLSYQALAGGAGLVDFGRRTLVELTGADRAKFLHSFSTADIQNLLPPAGCEAFLTTAQGKILGHVVVLADRDTILLETVADQGAAIVKHLDRYLIREKVTIRERTSDLAEWFLVGPQTPGVLEKLGGAAPGRTWTGGEATIAGQTVALWRVDLVGPVGFLIVGSRSASAAIGEALIATGATPVVPAAFEAARIEAGFPLYGVDISERNLPQEVGRDERTISFKKGCYLGQETVARIDALGHVNWLLRGLRFDGQEMPPAGQELFAAGVVVGHVTSVAFSPSAGAAVALAYLRRGHDAPGTRLDWPGGTAEVVALPIKQNAASAG